MQCAARKCQWQKQFCIMSVMIIIIPFQTVVFEKAICSCWTKMHVQATQKWVTGILNRQKNRAGKGSKRLQQTKGCLLPFLFTSVLPKRNIRVQEGRCREADTVFGWTTLVLKQCCREFKCNLEIHFICLMCTHIFNFSLNITLFIFISTEN